ncbi:MAG: hypothetical protein FWD33_02415 [Alphaproteobacteria bacterium]|nr:hypothetical protein [Alphaproteobacteria bacterium]
MPNKLEIINTALLKIGENPIESLTDQSASAILADKLFEPVTRSLQDSYKWEFIATKVEDYPDYFCGALVLKLAEEFCIPLTDNQALMRTLRDLFKDELKQAKLTDLRISGRAPVKNFSLINERY